MGGASFGLAIVLGVFAFGCRTEAPIATPAPCSDAWVAYVEQRIQSGDADGHGPDIGSLEWRSVVEFKLEIRDEPTVPALDSDHWCQYVDDHLRTHGR